MVRPPDGRRGGSWTLVILLIGLLAFAGSGAAGYAVVAAIGNQVGAANCGGSLCIPRLGPTKVVEALEEQGHECENTDGLWSCELWVGVVQYQASLSLFRGSISGLFVRVGFPQGLEPNDLTLSYLAWFAELPVANDPALAAELRAWVTDKIHAGQDARTSVAGYDYELRLEQGHSIMLDIGGRPPK